jgi:hypothetical protein
VVEICTYRGGTFYALCNVAAQNPTLVSIDLPGGLFGGGYTDNELRYIRGYGRPGQSLHFLAADSQQASTRDAVVERLDGRPIEFLLIDGDRRCEGVRRDFEPSLGKSLPDELNGAVGGAVVDHDHLRNRERLLDKRGEVGL